MSSCCFAPCATRQALLDNCCCSVLFKEVAVLGSGNFSRVYRVVGRLDGCEYAIKRSTRPLQSDAARRQWTQVRFCDACVCEASLSRSRASLFGAEDAGVYRAL